MHRLDFRTFQVVTDLQRIHRFLGEGTLTQIAQGDKTHFIELQPYLNTRPSAIPDPMSKATMDNVWHAATSPELHVSAFLTATSVLLLDAIFRVTDARDMVWLLEEYRKRFNAADPRVRAALMHGFDKTMEFTKFKKEDRPTQPELLTNDLASVEAFLTPIAKAMTVEEIDEVAEADRGYDAQRHKQALVNMLQGASVSFPKGDNWFPAEVVELISHVPSAPGHIPCTAIVLLDAIRSSDDLSHAEFRFKSQWKDYYEMPIPIKIAFYAALRYLYETDERWCSDSKHHLRNIQPNDEQKASIGWPD